MDFAAVEKGKHAVPSLWREVIPCRILGSIKLTIRQPAGTLPRLVMETICTQPERIRERDRVTRRVAIQIQPAGEANGVFLRETPDRAVRSYARAPQVSVACLFSGSAVSAFGRKTRSRPLRGDVSYLLAAQRGVSESGSGGSARDFSSAIEGAGRRVDRGQSMTRNAASDASSNATRAA